ncbi:MAG: hypothetical protein ACJASI_002430 [Glaciecola sp.]|jgi:hypothetical protein
MSLKPRPRLASLIAVLFVIGVIVLAISYWKNQVSPKTLTLNFMPVVADQALVFNQLNYTNPGGPGVFKIRDFQFYLSNIKLIAESTEHVEHESYHLVRFDNKNQNYVIEINNIVPESYHSIEFSIGVDQLANSSITVSGDLDPNSRMAWSWEVGYKFILFEGGILNEGLLRPLVYHVGFNENYKPLRFQVNASLLEQQSASLNFNVDLMKMFNSSKNIDMLELSSIKFDLDDAKVLANNYANMIQVN